MDHRVANSVFSFGLPVPVCGPFREKACRGWVLQMANCWPVVGTEGCWAPGSVPGLIAEKLFGSG